MVQVLMSTYNGEKYIKEQIDSILGQSYKDISILIRDDGSSDRTVDIIKEYSQKYYNITYYIGENIGAQLSFFDLFAHVEEGVSYIATCDQDDVWYPDKIETAITALKDLQRMGLYCCRTQLTDENLVLQEDKLRNYIPKIEFGNALIENVCTGCTMVINKRLYDFVKDKWPKQSVIHDWWFYQVAVCFGEVIYDNNPHIFYRQHDNNVIGLDRNHIKLIQRQIKTFQQFKGRYTAQMEEFIETFLLRGKNLYLAKLMVGTRNSWKCRWKALFEKDIFRQGKFDNILFKFMLFMGIL